MTAIQTIGMVLHPLRDATDAVDTILSWAQDHLVTVLGLDAEVARLNCRATAVSEREMAERANLLVALGGDGTVLRALRLAGQEPVGAGNRALWQAATERLDPDFGDRPLHPDVELARQLIEAWELELG